MPVRRRGVRVAKEFPVSLAAEQAANSLAERDMRGEIKLSKEGLQLVRAIMQGKNVENVANRLSELEGRNQIKLSVEVNELIDQLLVPGVEWTPAEKAAREPYTPRAFETAYSKGHRFAGRKSL
jgi:hypothetical protein